MSVRHADVLLSIFQGSFDTDVELRIICPGPECPFSENCAQQGEEDGEIPDGIGKHGQMVEKCRDVLIAYLQQEQRQRVMQDLAALEDFCDTDCQYLKTFRAVNGELQRWCHAGSAWSGPWQR